MIESTKTLLKYDYARNTQFISIRDYGHRANYKLQVFDMDDDGQPQLPIAISEIAGRYLLFDIKAIAWLRRNHNICGVFIGTLPQNPSQNVFMGLPMEIMPEEAQLLLDRGIAVILDDARAHDIALAKANKQRQKQYLSETRDQSRLISDAKAKEKAFISKQVLKAKAKKAKPAESIVERSTEPTDDAEESLFVPDVQSTISISASHNVGSRALVMSEITPTTSGSLIDTEAVGEETNGETATDSHNAAHLLHRHLMSLPNRTFFTTPGLRFGCQFCVYPGDPLRFHSHFLGIGVDWEEEIDLLDIVGGGRLGTGVKKGWLFGGEEPAKDGHDKNTMRCFSVEWAGM